MDGDLDLQAWGQTSDSPLNSDDSLTSITTGFGDLAINDVDENDDNNLMDCQYEDDEEGQDSAADNEEKNKSTSTNGRRREKKEEEDEALEANVLLVKLAGKFDDFNSTTVSLPLYLFF